MGLSKFFRNLNLGLKLNIGVVFALLILLVGITTTARIAVQRLTVRTGRQRVAQEAKVIQSRFDEAGQETLRATKLLASRPGLVESVADKNAAKVRTSIAVGAATLDFDDVSVLDADGELVAAVTKSPRPPGIGGMDVLLSFTSLGIEAIDIIVKEEKQELWLAAGVPLRDESGTTVGGLMASRKMDREFLEEINFLRQDVHLALVVNEQIMAQDFATPQQLEGFAADVLQQSAIEQALNGQTVVANDILHSTDDVPYALAHTTLTMRDRTYGVIGILVDLGELSAFQRQVAGNTTVVFGFLALAAVIIVTLFVRKSVAVPLVRLQAVAEWMASGDYHRRAEVTTTDEIGQLASAFNSMADQLVGLIGRLEDRTIDLQRRAVELEDLSKNLENAVDQSRRRALRLEAAAQVAHAITSVLNPDELLDQVVHLISDRVGYYHVGIFLLDEAGHHAILRVANSAGGQRMLARGHRLRVGEQGIVGYVTSTGQPRIALDVGADAVHFDNPDLPLTRSEIALPLVARGRILGALDVQSIEPQAFDDEDLAVLQTLANQVAVALDNARLFEESQNALREMQKTQAQYTSQAWRRHHTSQRAHVIEYTRPGIASLDDQPLPAADLAAATGETVAITGDDGQTPATLAVPLKLHGQTIGVLGFQKTEPGSIWTEDETALVEVVADEIAGALESARLFDDAQQRAWREQTVSQITAHIQSSSSIADILRTTAEELGRTLGVSRTIVRLGVAEDNPATDQ